MHRIGPAQYPVELTPFGQQFLQLSPEIMGEVIPMIPTASAVAWNLNLPSMLKMFPECAGDSQKAARIFHHRVSTRMGENEVIASAMQAFEMDPTSEQAAERYFSHLASNLVSGGMVAAGVVSSVPWQERLDLQLVRARHNAGAGQLLDVIARELGDGEIEGVPTMEHALRWIESHNDNVLHLMDSFLIPEDGHVSPLGENERAAAEFLEYVPGSIVTLFNAGWDWGDIRKVYGRFMRGAQKNIGAAHFYFSQMVGDISRFGASVDSLSTHLEEVAARVSSEGLGVYESFINAIRRMNATGVWAKSAMFKLDYARADGASYDTLYPDVPIEKFVLKELPAETQTGTVPRPVLRRKTLEDAWMPHLFHPDFIPYTAGKHVEIPPGERGAILSSNEHIFGPAPTAVMSLLEGGIGRLFGGMEIEGRVPEALERLAIDNGVFKEFSELFRLYIDDYSPIQQRFAEYFGHGIRGSQVYVPSGASQFIYKLIRSTNPEMGAVMAFMPGFFMYPIGAMAENRPFHMVPLNADFSYPLDRFLDEAKIVDPGLVIVDSPNNPTGGTVPPEWIVELVEQRARHNGYVLVDEAYFDYKERDHFTALSHVNEFPNLIILRSLAKVFGLAGGRIGAAVAAPDSVAERLFGRIKTPFEVAAMTVAMAEASLEPEALEYIRGAVELTVSERRRLYDAMTGIPGVRPVQRSEGNFILTDFKGTGRTALQVRDELESRRLYVRPLPRNPKFIPPAIADGYELLRISIGTPEQNNQLIEALQEIVGG